MKGKLLFLLSIFILNTHTVSFAAFPIATEIRHQTEDPNRTLAENTPLWGVLSFSISIITFLSALFFLPFSLYSISAFIFGILGLSKRKKGLAMIGLAISLLTMFLLYMRIFHIDEY